MQMINYQQQSIISTLSSFGQIVDLLVTPKGFKQFLSANQKEHSRTQSIKTRIFEKLYPMIDLLQIRLTKNMSSKTNHFR